MSQANDSSTDESMYRQTTAENDTILMVYADLEGAFNDPRAFVDELLGDKTGIDLFEQYTDEHLDVQLVIDFEEEVDGWERQFTESISPFSSNDKQALRQRFEEADLPDEFELVISEETETCFEHNVRRPVKNVIEGMVPRETIEAFGYEPDQYALGVADFSREIQDHSIDSGPNATIEQTCRVSAPSSGDIAVRDVLLHKEDRSQHKSFADERRWSFPVTVHLEAEDNEELNNIAQGVIPPMRMDLEALDGVECVRLKKCEKSVEKEGSCHQL